ncbi:hypothetical protein MBLNU457_3906t1 [Dothideomycetes sp. NU457]
MRRNQSFDSDREPFRDDHNLELQKSRVTGPFSALRPTQARYHINDSAGGLESQSKPPSNVAFKWRSRDNRKGRHTLVVRPSDPSSQYQTPPSTSSIGRIFRTIGKMFLYYPVWDISWWVAYIFTWGSIIWVINAFFVLLPYTTPSTNFPNEVLYGGGITAFIGATVFEIGSVLLILEAVNENRSSCFGWAVESLFETSSTEKASTSASLTLRPAKSRCLHHHANRKNFVGRPQSGAVEKSSSPSAAGRSWTWWPSTHDLRTHYFHDLGFIACFSQLLGATIFWIAGFTALPGINNKLSPSALDGAYWFPQVLGGCGFIISGFLFMLETQKKWYLPALDVLGWHIGAWNFIGGIGFTISPCFGFDTAYWAQYQASTSTFWGSWAFLIGSAVQLYESLEKNPVEVEKSS